jgi:transcriptional regulator GlxA family with amidase domain
MSPRNFARSYKAKTGRTPAKAVEVFRLEAARRLLEETEQGVDRIARSCGFGDEERMRTTFQRHLAISPRDYRRRFSTRPTTFAGGSDDSDGSQQKLVARSDGGAKALSILARRDS